MQASDRGLHYGDGLFETLLIKNQIPQYWRAHLARLLDGCQRLDIKPPCVDKLWDEASRLSRHQERGVLKIIITRGSGGRGYRSSAMDSAAEATRIVQRHPYPDYPEAFWRRGITLRMCHTPLSSHPVLAGIKHLNRLENVLARNEWCDEQVPEGIMKNLSGHWIEGTMTNVFFVKAGQLYTPDLAVCGVRGIMRQMVLEKALELGIQTSTCDIDDKFVESADELFVCNSVIGIWPVREFEGKAYKPGPITSQLRKNLIC